MLPNDVKNLLSATKNDDLKQFKTFFEPTIKPTKEEIAKALENALSSNSKDIDKYLCELEIECLKRFRNISRYSSDLNFQMKSNQKTI